MKNTPSTRRQFLGTAGLVGVGAALASCAPSMAATATSKPNLDVAVLNFALNLEYLEAAFYLAAVGRLSELEKLGLDANGGGASIILPTGSNSKQKAFTGARHGGMTFNNPAVRAYAQEIAEDELNHVKFLLKVLGSGAVIRPTIDIGPAFGNAAKAATKADGALAFSPFDDGGPNDLYFLHGAFIFEDVGVTAYKGAARLLTDDSVGGVLDSAAGILAVEAYHAGEIRTLLYANRDADTGYGVDVKTLIQAISDLRGAVGGGKDQGLVVNGAANIIPTDANSVAFGRSTREVLNIVYLGADATKGGFFPDGLNGAITR
ncbi:ferritin-like domain-containing protein (plasmid) [Deinococcus radiomollis]|uniref:ferritin-like domain-containing protein n=1 Tax=Deinococcus radiomollis TaxID=468916 RepID=UPI0038912A02